MKVQDIMTKQVRACEASTSLARAAGLMWELDCGALPVVNAEQKVIGMITDRDIAIALGTRGVEAAHIMVKDVLSADVFTTMPQAKVHDAIEAMIAGKVRRVPVVDEAGQLEGILSLYDLAKAANEKSRKAEGIHSDDVLRLLKAFCNEPVEKIEKLKRNAPLPAANLRP